MTEYEKYQLQWLIDHEHSLEDFVRELNWYAKQGTEDNLLPVFSDWQREYGFNGEIFVCEEEFYDNEHLMEETEQ